MMRLTTLMMQMKMKQMKQMRRTTSVRRMLMMNLAGGAKLREV